MILSNITINTGINKKIIKRFCAGHLAVFALVCMGFTAAVHAESYDFGEDSYGNISGYADRSLRDLLTTGDYKSAEKIVLQGMESSRKIFGPESDEYFADKLKLAEVYRAMHKFRESEREIQDVIDYYKKKESDKKEEQMLKAYALMVKLMIETGKDKYAIKFSKDALKYIEDSADADVDEMARFLYTMGYTYAEAGSAKKAREAFNDARTRLEEKYGEDDPRVAMIIFSEGKIFRASRNFKGAEQNYLKAYEMLKQKLPDDNKYVSVVREHLIRLYYDSGRADKGDRLMEEASLSWYRDTDQPESLYITTPEAGRGKDSGFAIVVLTVSAQGRVTDATISQSTAGKAFDEAVLRETKKWRFKPRIKDGKPVEFTGKPFRINVVY